LGFGGWGFLPSAGGVLIIAFLVEGLFGSLALWLFGLSLLC
jgi:hypothetical protein